MKKISIFLIIASLVACVPKKAIKLVELQNPIIPGYFADPSIVMHEGKFYMYATVDPWGAEYLSCWISDDFQNWTFQKLNWPTKEACTSPLSNHNNVWAPSVIEKDGVFYMYVSVGSEIWTGKASHPLGPWHNMLGDQPMVPFDTTRFVHVIDAEAFIDCDGRAYLYWGSGWDWINGRCFAAELNEDMASFKTEPIDITPTRFFEAPHMLKHDGKYFLTYSEGKTIDETYEVRYAVGDNPLGPFAEAENSPILTMNESLQVYGPGHHTFFAFEGKNYILYHRHRLPFVRGRAYRQTCINEFTFCEEKPQINTIIPLHTQTFPNLVKNPKDYIQPELVSASSEQNSHTVAANVLDNNFGTRWEAANDDISPILTVSFKNKVHIDTMEIRFEYPWKNYFIRIETSLTDNDWEIVADYATNGISGSPVLVPVNMESKRIRVTFENKEPNTKASVWELYFY